MKVNIALCTLFLFCTSQAIFASTDLSAVEHELMELRTIIRTTQENLKKKYSEIDSQLVPHYWAIENTVSTNITHVIDEELNAAKARAEDARVTNQYVAEKCYNKVEPLAKALNETMLKDVEEVENNIGYSIDNLTTQFNDNYEIGNEYMREINEIYETCVIFGPQKNVCIESIVNELQVEVANYKHNNTFLIDTVKEDIDNIFSAVKYVMEALISQVNKGIAYIDKQVISCLNKIKY